MRYPSGHKERTRARIVAAASALFRRHGYGASGVGDVMRAAGLTAGGFYAHFRSKESLLATAVTEALRVLENGIQGKPGEARLREMIGRYLGLPHLQHPEQGCPLPPLLGELARSSRSSRRAVEPALRQRFQVLRENLPPHNRAQRAIVLLATMVGGMSLARAVADQSLAEEILTACREYLVDEFAPGGESEVHGGD